MSRTDDAATIEDALTELLHAAHHVAHTLPAPTWTQASNGYQCYGPKRQCLPWYREEARLILRSPDWPKFVSALAPAVTTP